MTLKRLVISVPHLCAVSGEFFNIDCGPDGLRIACCFAQASCLRAHPRVQHHHGRVLGSIRATAETEFRFRVYSQTCTRGAITRSLQERLIQRPREKNNGAECVGRLCSMCAYSTLTITPTDDAPLRERCRLRNPESRGGVEGVSGVSRQSMAQQCGLFPNAPKLDRSSHRCCRPSFTSRGAVVWWSVG